MVLCIIYAYTNLLIQLKKKEQQHQIKELAQTTVIFKKNNTDE